ncbi:MAG TPA: hypothetical protein VKT73_06345 [Xanthobacteraceae bacterium]|nr:hypothetical protein [Xanthobacteraceae bacterium]
MSRADFYLHKAAQCEMLARVAGCGGERERQLQTARHYRQAAEREKEQVLEHVAGGKP